MDARLRQEVPKIGIGDEIMASGQVRELHILHKAPVLIVDRHGNPRWHEIWNGNPRLVRTNVPGCVRLSNGGGIRPYIASKTSTHWTWKRWDISSGEIYLDDIEKRFGSHFAGRILIEPHTKVPNGNKSWSWERWQEVVDRSGLSFIQTGPHGTRPLLRVEFVPTSFRQACSILAVSKAFVGTEGGLMHAAAALGITAVVLWSEYISMEFTGYASQRNIRHAGPACGTRVPCGGCKQSMDLITTDEVITELEQIAC